jgi:hypothetical protein
MNGADLVTKNNQMPLALWPAIAFGRQLISHMPTQAMTLNR